jgi:hypothetical protein
MNGPQAMAAFAFRGDCARFHKKQFANVDIAERDGAGWICAFVEQRNPRAINNGGAKC